MSDPREPLERLVNDLARAQPLRRAPAGLESRVLARIAVASSSLPWWRRSFSEWPLAARVAFLAASYGFVRLALAGFMLVTDLFAAREAAGTAIVHRSAEAVSVTVSLGDLILHAIPPMWLYGAAVCGFVLYALLFGLGTVAYRTLYVER